MGLRLLRPALPQVVQVHGGNGLCRDGRSGMTAPKADDVSLERAWSELNQARRGHGAPQPTVEALVFGLREGIEALPTKPDRLRRLSRLSEKQLREVCSRVRNFKPHIARAWTPEEVEALCLIWKENCDDQSN